VLFPPYFDGGSATLEGTSKQKRRTLRENAEERAIRGEDANSLETARNDYK
jgi:hypothetical protein